MPLPTTNTEDLAGDAVQPAPSIWKYAHVQMNDGTVMVFVQIGTPAGITMVFLSPEEAKNVAAQIDQIATDAQKSLIKGPPPSLLLPDGFGKIQGPNGRPMPIRHPKE